MAEKNSMNHFLSKGPMVWSKGFEGDVYIDILGGLQQIKTSKEATTNLEPKSMSHKVLVMVQPWLAALAVLFAVLSLYDSMFETLYNVSVFDCTKASPMISSLDPMPNGGVSYIPAVLGIILQLYQVVSAFVYFLALQLGTAEKLKDLSVIFLWYPITGVFLAFCVYSEYYLQTVRLSLQIMLLCLYQLWLVLTIDHSF